MEPPGKPHHQSSLSTSSTQSLAPNRQGKTPISSRVGPPSASVQVVIDPPVSDASSPPSSSHPQLSRSQKRKQRKRRAQEANSNQGPSGDSSEEDESDSHPSERRMNSNRKIPADSVVKREQKSNKQGNRNANDREAEESAVSSNSNRMNRRPQSSVVISETSSNSSKQNNESSSLSSSQNELTWKPEILKAVEYKPSNLSSHHPSSSSKTNKSSDHHNHNNFGGHNHANHHQAKVDLTEAVQGQTELASNIITDLLKNKYECHICFLAIRPSVATWVCNHCYGLFHVACAKKWARTGLSAPNTPNHQLRWNCPNCRHAQEGAPNSWCFCGKLKDPQYAPMRVPHSCGDVCLRPRTGTDCPHKCSLQCHPGPCPPCAAMSPVKYCWCRRATYRKRCGQHDEGQSCGSICSSVLNCKVHKCPQACHPGNCPPCKIELDQTCYCGKQTTKKLCGDPNVKQDISVYGQKDPRFFSCNEVCGRTLDCGNHQCDQVCHTGPCKPCSLAPKFILNCGCGAKAVSSLLNGQQRQSCMDPIPTCDNICSKKRSCGHKCPQLCHNGACPPCEQQVHIQCRCRCTEKTVLCHTVYPKSTSNEFTCDRACGRMKSCGKHQCTTRCCPSFYDTSDPEGFHVCRVTCNKKLKCGTHQCKQPCHKGACGRCLEANFNDIVCPCGKTIQEAPIVCGTPKLICHFPCVVERQCSHIDHHLCHEGACPPCIRPIDVQCVGGHTTLINIPCYKKSISCGKVCGKPMHCGLHNCKRVCHSGPCMEDESTEDQQEENQSNSNNHHESHENESTSKESTIWNTKYEPKGCGQACRNSLFSCEHFCVEPCHPGKPCPDIQCTQLSRISCDCGVLSAQVPCVGKEKQVLPCNNSCIAERRSRLLAEAFGQTGNSTTPPRYSELLLNMACAAPAFITKIEIIFEDFLKSPATLTRQELSPMDRVQRMCVHELAKFYGLATESFGSDERKQRSVTIIKRKESKLPSVPLRVVSGVTNIHQSATPNNSNALYTAQSTAMLIYDLHKGITTNILHSFLTGFHNDYTLQWIDDETCVAIFKDPMKLERAMTTLQPRGVFKIKMFQDVAASSQTIDIIALPPTQQDPSSSSSPSVNSNQASSSASSTTWKALETASWANAVTNPRPVAPTNNSDKKQRTPSPPPINNIYTHLDQSNSLDGSNEWW